VVFSTTTARQQTLSFSRESVDLFGLASGDTNRLHSDPHAAAHVTGIPVVHGVLQLLAALATVPDLKLVNPSSVEVAFCAPAFIDVLYVCETEILGNGNVIVTIRDGSLSVMRARIRFDNSKQPESFGPFFAIRNAEGYLRIRAVQVQTNLDLLLARLGLTEFRMRRQIACMLLCSKVVGVHLPGATPLFSHFQLVFDRMDAPITQDLVCNVESAFGNTRGHSVYPISIYSGESIVATGTLTAQLNAGVPIPADEVEAVSLCGALKGSVALVTGGTRGIGAMLSEKLSARGCIVYSNYLSNEDSAQDLLKHCATMAGPICLEKGDVATEIFCETLVQRVLSRTRRLDYVFLNATPPILPISLSGLSPHRAYEYIWSYLQITTMPLNVIYRATSLKPTFILISSTYSSGEKPYLAHYIAAKQAAEGLFCSFAQEVSQGRFLVVRIPQVATDVRTRRGMSLNKVAANLLGVLFNSQSSVSRLQTFSLGDL
jgi:NAD(P)-dependent dehydrogenase (short-subunit alcohol dehydrogenase family)